MALTTGLANSKIAELVANKPDPLGQRGYEDLKFYHTIITENNKWMARISHDSVSKSRDAGLI